MTPKEKLIHIIKQKGLCTGVNCGDFTSERCPFRKSDGEISLSCIGMNKPLEECYAIALQLFIKQYGKAELFEVLI